MEFSVLIQEWCLAVLQNIPNYYLILLFPALIMILGTLSSVFSSLCSVLIPPDKPPGWKRSPKELSKEEIDQLYEAWQQRIKNGE